MIAAELKKYPEIKMEWSEPGLDFRISFIKTDSADDYGRLRTIANDCERLRTITSN